MDFDVDIVLDDAEAQALGKKRVMKVSVAFLLDGLVAMNRLGFVQRNLR